MAGKDKSERTVVGNGGKRGQRPEEGLPWPKMSDQALEAAEASWIWARKMHVA